MKKRENHSFEFGLWRLSKRLPGKREVASEKLWKSPKYQREHAYAQANHPKEKASHCIFLSEDSRRQTDKTKPPGGSTVALSTPSKHMWPQTAPRKVVGWSQRAAVRSDQIHIHVESYVAQRVPAAHCTLVVSL